MFPENLVQACFQQIQTEYTPKKSKNATAKEMQLTTTATDLYDHYVDEYDSPYKDVDESTTAAALNLSGVSEAAFTRSLHYVDGINVLG